MKSEERKENETNSLGMWLAHLRNSMSGRGLYVVIGALVLVTAGVLVYRYWSISRANAYSALVLEFNFANTNKDLEKITTSDSHKGKGPASWARLQLARLSLYPDGLSKLGAFVPAEREAAVSHVEESHKRYEEISADNKSSAIQQEAFVKLALSEECLLGTPKATNSAELRGSFDKMIEYYRKAAAINPDSPASKRYAARADQLKAKRDELEKFYATLNTLGAQAPRLPKSFGQ